MSIKSKIPTEKKSKQHTNVRGWGMEYKTSQISKTYLHLFAFLWYRIGKMCDIIFLLVIFGRSTHHSCLIKWKPRCSSAQMETKIFISIPSLLGINRKHDRLSTSNTEIRGITHPFYFLL